MFDVVKMRFNESEVSDSQVRPIEQIVNEAKGESITIERLVKSPKRSFIKRVSSIYTSPQGPFHQYIHPEEQPQYLFHNCKFHVEDISDLESMSVVRSGWERGYNKIAPVTVIFTSKRVIMVYADKEGKYIESVNYVEIEGVYYNPRFRGPEAHLHTPEQVFYIEFPLMEEFFEEIEEAHDFLISQCDFDGEFHGFEAEEEDYSSFSDILKNQLYKIKDVAMRADLEYVAEYGVKGAKIGVLRGGYAGVVGFTIGAGYGLWKDLSGRSEQKYSSDDIDPQETAQTMVRWKQAGEKIGGRNAGVAGAVIGAALAIDAQTSGREVTKLLSNSDIEWVTTQLEADPDESSSLEVASNAVDIYTRNLIELFDEDFFEKLEK